MARLSGSPATALIGSIALALAVSSCRTDCAPIGRFGLAISVRDIRTRAAPVDGSVLVVRDGAYEEHHPMPGSALPKYSDFSAATDRAGTYDITVTTPGYHDWTKSGVQVRRGSCEEVQTVQLTAFVSPL